MACRECTVNFFLKHIRNSFVLYYKEASMVVPNELVTKLDQIDIIMKK